MPAQRADDERSEEHRNGGREEAPVAACLAPSVLVRTLAIGFVFQALVVLVAWLVARSISLGVPFAVVAASLAPVLIISALPISMDGFGVREGSYVVLLSYAGVGATDATVFSLLSAAAFALASLPGAAALLLRRAPGSARAAEAEDREQERGEEDLQSGDKTGRGDERHFALAERSESLCDPNRDRDDAPDSARED